MNNFWLKQWLEIGFKAMDAEENYELWCGYGAMKLVTKGINTGGEVEEDSSDERSLKALSQESAIYLASMVNDIIINSKDEGRLLSLADVKDLNAINKEIHNAFIKGQLVKSTDEGLERFRKSLKC